MKQVPYEPYTDDIRAIRYEDGLNANYCIRKALEYIEMADVYIADMEDEIKTLKKQLDGKTD